MPDCPSVAELLEKIKSLTRQTDGTFHTAWSDSFIDPYHCCEQGGFIYIGKNDFQSLTAAMDVQTLFKQISLSQAL